MRLRTVACLLSMFSLALGAAAAAQELPSVPTGPGFVGPVFPSEGVLTMQFTVDVVGRLTPISGSTADHFLTFSAPFEVPGAALAPGTYVFRVVGPSVIQVTSPDNRSVYSQFLASPIVRSTPVRHHEVVLERRLGDAPMRMVGLFLPGAATGFEPAYATPSSCVRILRDLNLPTDLCKGGISD